MIRVSALLTVFIIMAAASAVTFEETEVPFSLTYNDGKLYVGYERGNLRVFDAESLELLQAIDTDQRGIWTVRADEQNVYFGTSRNKANSMKKNGEMISSAEHSGYVNDMFLKDDILYTCSRNEVKMYLTPELELLGSTNNSGFCKSIRVDDRYIYAPTNTTGIGIWDRKTLSKVTEIDAHESIVPSIWDDERNIYSASDDGTIKVWSKKDFSLQATVRDAPNPWSLQGDENFLYATSGGEILIITKGNWEKAATLNTGSVWAYQIEVTGDAFYSVGDDGTVKKWDKGTFQNTATSDIFTYTIEVRDRFEGYRLFFYALLVVGIVGYAWSHYKEKKKPK